MSSPRINAGKLKGLRLKSIPGTSTRPITDRVKEALFNLIGPDIQGSKFLDMFGGTGSVGIEALSRGAELVQFIEKNNTAYLILVENISKTDLITKTILIHGDAFDFVHRKSHNSFDYIFIAPPQYKQTWKKILHEIDTRPALMSKDAWVIIQIDPREYENTLLKNLSEFDKRDYGNTRLIFYIKN